MKKKPYEVVHTEWFESRCNHTGDYYGDSGCGCASTGVHVEIRRFRNGHLWRYVHGGCSGTSKPLYNYRERVHVEDAWFLD